MKSKGEITRGKENRHETDEKRNKIGTVAHLGAGADSAKPEGQCAHKAPPTESGGARTPQQTRIFMMRVAAG